MFLVLTYHRIVESPDAIADFFDVCASELESQIALVKNSWGRCASPSTLLEAQDRRDDARQGFLITFDDGTADHFTMAAPLLERQGARGIFFVNTARLGSNGYLNIQQCQELQARGHAIESHSHEHKRLTQLPAGVLHRHLAESRRTLRDLGLGLWDFLAPPGGDMDASTIQAANAEGYRLLRTLAWGYNRDVDPLSLQSITVNRSTAGSWFRPLISPRGESVKRAFYRTKEFIKRGSLGPLYLGLRDPNPKTRTTSQTSGPAAIIEDRPAADGR